jgi:hypothetical protein
MVADNVALMAVYVVLRWWQFFFLELVYGDFHGTFISILFE